MSASARSALVLATVAVAGPVLWGLAPTPDTGPVLPLERAAIAAPAPSPSPEVHLRSVAERAEQLAALAATTTTLPPSTTTSTVDPVPVTTSSSTTTAPIRPPDPTTTTAPAPTRSSPQAAASTTARRDAECESAMLGWMDQTRTDHGVARLQPDPQVQHVPVDWSQTMAERSDLAHNPDYGDQIFADRPEAQTAAENVGRSTVDARAVYDEFLRSADHRDKILGERFTHVAVGCVRDAQDQLWVTINFWG